MANLSLIGSPEWTEDAERDRWTATVAVAHDEGEEKLMMVANARPGVPSDDEVAECLRRLGPTLDNYEPVGEQLIRLSPIALPR